MQGREKPVIIFSAVRCNLQGKLGFLEIKNRINVALTRAQHCLIIIGNSRTLKQNPDWNTMIREFIKDGLIVNGTEKAKVFMGQQLNKK